MPTLCQRSCANVVVPTATMPTLATLRQRSCAIWVVDSIDLHIKDHDAWVGGGGGGDPNGRTLGLVPIGPVDQCMPTKKTRKNAKKYIIYNFIKMSASVRVRPRLSASVRVRPHPPNT